MVRGDAVEGEWILHRRCVWGVECNKLDKDDWGKKELRKDDSSRAEPIKDAQMVGI